MNKKLIGLSLAIVVCLSLSISAFALPYGCTGILPAKQGDEEISTVTKETNADTWLVEVSVTDTEYEVQRVHAWTERGLDVNCSSPSRTISVGKEAVMDYDRIVPSVGENVTLNVDNPSYVSYTVEIEGSWSPR